MTSTKEEVVSRAHNQAARVNEIFANENEGMRLFLNAKMGGVLIVAKYARQWLDTGQLEPELLNELLDHMDAFINRCADELKDRKRVNQ